MTKEEYLETYNYLTDKEAYILSEYDKGRSAKEIGDTLGITKSRVIQIKNKAENSIKVLQARKSAISKQLSIDSMNISEMTKILLKKSGCTYITDVFTLWKDNKLDKLYRLGKKGYNDIVIDLCMRNLGYCVKTKGHDCMDRREDEEYYPHDLTEIECRVYLLYKSRLESNVISNLYFNGILSGKQIEKIYKSASEKTRIGYADKYTLKELDLPFDTEGILVLHNIYSVNRLIEVIDNGEIFNYKEINKKHLGYIFRGLDAHRYKYFRRK